MHHLCITDPQTEACRDEDERAPCVFDETPGFCDHGVCVPSGHDLDGDGAANADDNCPDTANPEQSDGDGDAFGDACDLCPGLETATNHDEDGDRFGDDCDSCPNVADFQIDADQDGVGDACEAQSTDVYFSVLVTFDPFVTLAAPWSATGVQWSASRDVIIPDAPLPLDDPGLADRTTVLPDKWRMAIGFGSMTTWQPNDRFGIGLLDEQDVVVASCVAECSASSCSARVDVAGAKLSVTISPAPTGELLFEHRAASTFECGTAQGRVLLTMQTAPPGALTPTLLSVPNTHISYFALWR